MMAREYDIGIDIGGTNTDAVVIDRDKKDRCILQDVDNEPIISGA